MTRIGAVLSLIVDSSCWLTRRVGKRHPIKLSVLFRKRDVIVDCEPTLNVTLSVRSAELSIRRTGRSGVVFDLDTMQRPDKLPSNQIDVSISQKVNDKLGAEIGIDPIKLGGGVEEEVSKTEHFQQADQKFVVHALPDPDEVRWIVEPKLGKHLDGSPLDFSYPAVTVVEGAEPVKTAANGSNFSDFEIIIYCDKLDLNVEVTPNRWKLWGKNRNKPVAAEQLYKKLLRENHVGEVNGRDVIILGRPAMKEATHDVSENI